MTSPLQTQARRAGNQCAVAAAILAVAAMFLTGCDSQSAPPVTVPALTSPAHFISESISQPDPAVTNYAWSGVPRADASAYPALLSDWLCGDMKDSLTICAQDQGTVTASILVAGSDLTVTLKN